MSILKTEIKQAVLHSIGCDADDWLEGAKRDVSKSEGARHALIQAAKNIQQIAAVVDQDIDNGKIASLDGALDIATYAKLQITRAVDSLVNASRAEGNRQKAAVGEIAAYEKLVTHLQKLHTAEGVKAKSIKEAIDAGDAGVDEDGMLSQTSTGGNGRPVARAVGVRPGQSIAAQRKAEAAPKPPAKAPKAKKKTKKRVMTCGHCGKKGHTRRTCNGVTSAANA